MNRRTPLHAGKHAQRGAALFVALMLLVIVSILGVSVAQVTALQERMASNYRVDDLGFQNADGFLRSREVEIARQLGANKSRHCRPDAAISGTNMIPAWKENATANASAYEALQGNNGPGRSSGLQGNDETTKEGIEAASWECIMFRVAAVGLGSDDDETADTASRTIVQSTYILE